MHNSPILDRIATTLAQRKEQGLFRQTASFHHHAQVLDCSTNSYLGLHTIRAISEQAAQLAHHSFSGNLASRLIAEYSPLYRELEKEIADWENTEDALIFTCGYTANLGIMQALCNRSTEVFSDRLNHASIYDGIRLAGARLVRYRHCDMSDLKKRLEASRAKEKIIITDTVFSMDGDTAPLADIASLALSHNALVIVDEAHATGLFGTSGSGLVEATGTASAIPIRMGTFSKAIAGLGGYVAASSHLRDYFVNYARSVIYSTGLPGHVLAYNCAAVRYIRAHPLLGSQLRQSAAQFRKRMEAAGYSTTPSTTHIIPYYTRNADEAVALKKYLYGNQIVAPAIRPPTVPEGTSRLRFSWSHLFSENDAEYIVGTLIRWKELHG